MHYLTAGETMLDVGANVATYSLLATTIDDVSVVAYEPSSVAYERARVNIELNGMERRIRLLRQAVGARQGAAVLSVGLGPRNRLIGPADTGHPAGTGEEVPVTTLDDLLTAGIGPVGLIKIDVEGGELDVLDGGRRLIRRDGPALIIEVNDPAGTERYLEELGYSCWSYDADGGRLDSTTVYHHIGRNMLALRDVKRAQARLAGEPV
jgi:FkbM family methyltransferase